MTPRRIDVTPKTIDVTVRRIDMTPRRIGITPRRFGSAARCALALVIAAALAGCAGPTTKPGATPSSSAVPQSAQASGVILFDMAHGEVFGPDDASQLGQSQLVELARSKGYEVRVNEGALTSDALEGVALVYVPGPMRPFTNEEKSALDSYLADGGTVLLSIHVPYPVLSTPARWGLPVGTHVMATTKPTESDAGVFTATGIVDDPLTRDINEVLVVSGWSVSVDAQRLAKASVVVTAGPDVVVDTNGDNRIDAAESTGPFGVIGVAPVGAGRVIVLGDDAIFANVAIGQADNLQLLDNILEQIRAPRQV